MAQNPTNDLIENAKASLRDANGNATPQYRAYLRYRDEYQKKVDAKNEAYASASVDPMKLQQWPRQGVAHQEEVDAAWDKWIALGFKIEVEQAINTLAAQGIPSSPL